MTNRVLGGICLGVVAWSLACGGENPSISGLDAAGDCANDACGAADAADARDVRPPPRDFGPAPDFGPGDEDVSALDPGQDPGPGDVPPADPGPPECDSSGDCALGNVCVQHACVPGCGSDRDCPVGRVCNPNGGPNGLCVECLDDGGCPEGRKCIAGTCQFRCGIDADCGATPGTPHCFAGTGTCVTCTQDAHCTLGTICEGQSCVAGCRGDRDCAQGLFCDPAAGDHGQCFQCLADKDCPPGTFCVDHACGIDCAKVNCPAEKPICSPDTGTCVQCLTKAQCGAGQVCFGNACATGCETDGDCASPNRCKAVPGAPGLCVRCLVHDDCPSGQVCNGNACGAKPACTGDAGCGVGNYCHPKLGQCYKLPSNSCSTDNECGIFPGFGGFCDPLTRTCGEACLLGFCGILGGGTDKPVCVDGGCYECATAQDCPGTECSLFDLTCTACQGDGDCADPSWHCDASLGRCYPCVNDFQCGPGRKCRTTDHVCVDCLSNAMCTNPATPVCGKDGTCIGACSDACVKDQTACVQDNDDAYVRCGDWDNDPCLEFGGEYGPSGYACAPYQVCVPSGGGLGKCTCQDQCSSGQARCNASGAREVCSQHANSGCWYWDAYSDDCPTGQVCSGSGTCVCEHECSSGQRKCSTSGSTTYYTCETDGAGCRYWYTRYCTQGYYCSGGTCYP